MDENTQRLLASVLNQQMEERAFAFRDTATAIREGFASRDISGGLVRQKLWKAAESEFALTADLRPEALIEFVDKLGLEANEDLLEEVITECRGRLEGDAKRLASAVEGEGDIPFAFDTATKSLTARALNQLELAIRSRIIERQAVQEPQAEHPLLEELGQRRQLVEHISHHDAQVRMADLLKWLEENESTDRILQALRADVDIRGLMEAADRDNPPAAASPEEIAGVGLALARACANEAVFWKYALHEVGIWGPHDSTDPDDVNDEAFTLYISPFLDHVEQKLEELSLAATPESVLESQVESVFSAGCRRKFPETVRSLESIAEAFADPQEEGEWFKVGYSCRNVLLTFADELRQVLEMEQPKGIEKDNFTGSLDHILSELVPGGGQFKETLRGLLRAVWKHVSVLGHRGKGTGSRTSRSEARRLYIWLALLISDLAEIALKNGRKG